jgi:putative ATP-binding cassette transporter
MWERHPWLTVGTALSGAIGGFTGIAIVDTINSAIHDVQRRPQLALVFVALALAAIVFRNASSLFPAYAAREIATSLRVALSRKILGTSLETIDRRGMANVLTLVSDDIPQLMGTLLLLPMILVETITLLFALGYLAYLSWGLLLLTAIAIPLGLMLYRLFLQRGMFLTRKLREESITFNAHSLSLLFGIKELQLNKKRRRWFQRTGFEFSSRRLARYEFLQKAWFTAGGNVDEIVYYSIVGTFIFGISSFFNPVPAALTASILALMYVTGPVRSLVAMIPDVGQGVVSCERLSDFGFPLDNKEINLLVQERLDVAGAQDKGWFCIEMQNVRVTYEVEEQGRPSDMHPPSQPAFGSEEGYGEEVYRLLNPDGDETSHLASIDQDAGRTVTPQFRLGPINMQLRPGELVFIVGSNGSGKSTLAKVITGLYTPSDGEILLDGVPISESNRERYRNLFTTVFTDFHLFDRVLGADKQAQAVTLAQEYLVKLGLADKIQIVRNKFSTTTALSNGQRKRLALLCAYLEDRPILVLDEWAADQDPAFKKFFYEVLLDELKRQGKCVVVISHDDRYFELADRIVHLKEGNLVMDVDRQEGGPRAAEG